MEEASLSVHHGQEKSAVSPYGDFSFVWHCKSWTELWVLPGWERKDYFLRSLHGIPNESKIGRNDQ